MTVVVKNKKTNDVGIIFHRDKEDSNWWFAGITKDNKTISIIEDAKLKEEYEFSGDIRINFILKHKKKEKIYTIFHRDRKEKEADTGWWMMGVNPDDKAITMVNDKELIENYEFFGNLQEAPKKTETETPKETSETEPTPGPVKK